MELLRIAGEFLGLFVLFSHFKVLLVPDFEKFHIYCDESCTSDRYTVIGAVFCRADTARTLADSISLVAAAHGGTSELKWAKVKKHNFRMYAAVMEEFFAALHKGYVQYYALVVDNSQMNHKLYNEGDKEIGFSKMLFQLLWKFIRIFRSRPRFFAFLDDRTTQHTPQKLRRMLNQKAANDLNITHNPYRYCEFHDSKSEVLIQVADVITGAIGYRRNRKNILTVASRPKIEMVSLITKLAKVDDLANPTRKADQSFDIWHIDFEARARRRV